MLVAILFIFMEGKNNAEGLLVFFSWSDNSDEQGIIPFDGDLHKYKIGYRDFPENMEYRINIFVLLAAAK